MKHFWVAVMVLNFINQVQGQRITNPDALFNPTPYGFSHVVSVPANSEFIFVAGQGGEENSEGKLSNDFKTQVTYALKNISTALESQNADMNNVIKVTTLVVNHNEEKLDIIVEEFKRAWPGFNFPVNTLIPVSRLALDGMLVEIDAIAFKAGKN